MLEASKYLEIVRKRGLECKGLERVYRLIRKESILLQAYINLYPNKGANTLGISEEDVIDGMSMEKIKTLSEDLKVGKFKWKPVKRTYIPKKYGKKRPLGITSWTDKLVQEAMRIVLEEYYEPLFSDKSHGFRRNRGCHIALNQIRNNGWNGVKWFIEGDVKGCFDNIDHKKLLEILSKDIKDSRFLKLVKDMLEAGYIENWRYSYNYSGVPQGCVISPLLSNVYMNELDKYVVKELIPKYTSGKQRSPNKEYRKLQRKLGVARQKGNKESARRILKSMRELSAGDPQDKDFKRLKYIRYADDFLCGFIGSKEEAKKIKDDIAEFLRRELNLDLSMEKTLITNASEEKARFLNYEISAGVVNHKQTKSSFDGKKRRSLNYVIQLRMPRDVLRNWIGKYTKGNKPIHNSAIINHSDYDIVMKYNLELRGLYNYYVLAQNVSCLNELKYYMRCSLVKTLASKHKCRATKIFRKYINKITKAIEVIVPRENKDNLIASFGDIKLKRRDGLNLNHQEDKYLVLHRVGSELLQRLLADKCELCGAKENIQVHHIKKISDLKRKCAGKKVIADWKRTMIAINRKTLIVCGDCHNLIHSGKYNGMKLTKV